MSCPAYDKYHDSGLEWLGEVPAHWTVLPIRMVARLESGHTPSRSRPEWWQDCTVPWFTLADVGQIREQRRKIIYQTQELVSELGLANSSARLLPKGTVMLSRTASVGFAAIMGVDMATTQDFANWVCGPRLNNEFLLFVFKAMTGEFERLRYGSTHNTIYMPDIAAFRLALPPLDEQQAIVDFLDRETAKIDTLVEEQRRLIALLKEKRQAVVSHAVTKGLDPEARMKDSGIAWLGEVPAHWTVTNAGRYLRILSGFAFPSEGFSTDPTNVRLLRGVNVGVGRIRWDETVYWPRSQGDSLSAFELSDGELVIGMDRPWIAEGVRIAKLSAADLPCLLLQRVAALRPTERLDPDYLHFILSSPAFVDYFTPDMTGVSVPHLSPGQISRFPIPLPPLKEQRAIVDYLWARLNEADRLISAAEHAITLLEERRSALISAAVTGKIDVRGSAQVQMFSVDRVHARGLVAIEIIERSVRRVSFGRVKLQKIAYLAEAHVGVSELEGAYLREAAGPLDREMVRDMEREAGRFAGIQVDQPEGARTAVSYRLGDQRGAHRAELATFLGVDRSAKLDKLIDDIATIDTKGAEAVATLYAVWNDALMDGETPTDTENVLAVLTEWHPEKKEKFRMDELHTWLGWMRRHGLVPRGSGPKTSTGRLFT